MIDNIKTTKNAMIKQLAMINNNFWSSLLSLNDEYAAIDKEDPAKLKTRKFGY